MQHGFFSFALSGPFLKETTHTWVDELLGYKSWNGCWWLLGSKQADLGQHFERKAVYKASVSGKRLALSREHGSLVNMIEDFGEGRAPDQDQHQSIVAMTASIPRSFHS